jgi:hypothetical protein
MDLKQVAEEHSERLDGLEDELGDLRARVALLERGSVASSREAAPSGRRAASGPEGLHWSPPLPRPRPRAASAPAAEPVAPRPAPRRRRDVEELLGGRVLGSAGGIAVLLGIGFLVAMAVNRGWLDERARIVLGFAGSATLLVGGLWLHETRGRTQAARAAVAAALAGLFATLTAATRLYDLLDIAAALGMAAAIGALGTAIAVRWRSTTVGALGIVGALAAPILVGASMSGATIAFTLIALAAATTVVVWQRWGGLAVAAFAVALPLVAAWLDSEPSPAAIVIVLSLVWILGQLTAFGLAARADDRLAAPFALVLLAGTAIFVAAGGYLSLLGPAGLTVASLSIAAVAVGQLGAGLLARGEELVHRDVSGLSLATSLAAADVAFVLIADGAVLTVGFAASAVALAALARVRNGGESDRGATVAVLAQLALAIAHALIVDAHPGELAASSDPRLATVVSLAVLCAALVASARLRRQGSEPQLGILLDALGVAVLAYLTAYVLDGPAVAVALALEAVVVVALARAARLPHGGVGAAGLLLLATAHALAFEAVPRALVYGVADLGSAALALAAVAVGAAAAARLAPTAAHPLRLGLWAVAATALVYLGSVAIVTGFQPKSQVLVTDLTLLSVRQQGQLLLSAFWSVTGVAALVVGLRRRNPYVRWGGFCLLGAATAKVFLFDLSALESLYRVGSFVALGLLLLGAAFAYQRLRGPNGAPGPAG